MFFVITGFNLPRIVSELSCNDYYLEIILRNAVEYRLKRPRRLSHHDQTIFCKIEQDNCFIIQHIETIRP